MGIFRVNEGNKSYAYPISKIIVCVLLIVVMINRDHIIRIDNKAVNIVVGILCFAAAMACFLCIYISAAELLLAHENRTKRAVLPDSVIAKSKKYPLDHIVFLAESNDIIEIQIVSKNRAVEVGSSSDCKNGSSKFFDKRYYIGDEMFEAIKDFQSALLPYAANGQISVICIDGLAPK